MYHGLEELLYSKEDQVPWSHGRESVPLWLANHGVALDAWQEWVDRATELWIDRNKVCRKLIMSGRNITLYSSINTALWLPTTYLPDTIIFFLWRFGLFLSSMLCCTYVLKWKRFRAFELSRIEENWSDLIRDIQASLGKDNNGLIANNCYNETFGKLGCCPNAVHLYTIGIRFIHNSKDGYTTYHDDSCRKTSFLTNHMRTRDYGSKCLYDLHESPSTLQTDDINVTLKLIPCDLNFGQNLTSLSHPKCTHSQNIVIPWSHGPDEVPNWLSSRGVTLTSWQEWVNQASVLWIDRIQQSNKHSRIENKCLLGIMVILLLTIIPFLSFVPRESSYFQTGKWIIISFVFIYLCLAMTTLTFTQQSDFLKIESEWSDLVQNINAGIGKKLGLRANHCYDFALGRPHFIFLTVGIVVCVEPEKVHDSNILNEHHQV